MHLHIIRHPERSTLRRPDQEGKKAKLAKVISHSIPLRDQKQDIGDDRVGEIKKNLPIVEDRIMALQAKLALLQARRHERMQELSRLNPK
jgi:hypothetical protein